MTKPTLRLGPLLPLAFVLLATITVACAESSTGPNSAIKVLVLTDDGSEADVQRILDDAGFTVTMGPRWYAVTTTWIADSGWDAIVMLTGVEYRGRMPDASQMAIRDWVAAGGGLMTMEWFSYYASNNPILSAILPAYEDTYEYLPDTYTREVSNSITRGLPSEFATGVDSSDAPGSSWTSVALSVDSTPAKQAQVIYRGAYFDAPALVTGRWSAGRVVSWGMAGSYNGDSVWVAETERLLTNIVAYLAGR